MNEPVDIATGQSSCFYHLDLIRDACIGSIDARKYIASPSISFRPVLLGDESVKSRFIRLELTSWFRQAHAIYKTAMNSYSLRFRFFSRFLFQRQKTQPKAIG